MSDNQSFPWVVLKFGGSSVAVAEHWQTIAAQCHLQLAHQRRPLLVLSALKNVSNLLEALLHQAKAGVYQLPISHLQNMHLNFAAELGLELSQTLEPLFQSLTEDCIEIKGTPDIKLSASPEIPGGVATAAIAVNSIPRVLNAAPGLYTMADLPVPAAMLADARHFLPEELMEVRYD